MPIGLKLMPQLMVNLGLSAFMLAVAMMAAVALAGLAALASATESATLAGRLIARPARK